MDIKEIALKLVLDAIGEDPNIATVSDRLRLQKAVYLCQEMGIPLGYGYNWYVKGPYSPPLTQDYYNLDAALFSGDADTNEFSLHPELVQRADEVRRLLTLPDFEISKPNWYEALSSLHYLMKTSRKSFHDAKTFMSQAKPHLGAEVIDAAHARLNQYGLV